MKELPVEILGREGPLLARRTKNRNHRLMDHHRLMGTMVSINEIHIANDNGHTNS
jgi:hypothetical protein